MTNKTIIFDFDGTIANTMDIAMEIYNNVAPEFHCNQADPKDKEKLRSKTGQELIKLAGISYLRLPFLILRVQKELHHRMADIQPITGILEALKEIKKAKFDLGILTSNSIKNVNVFLETHGLHGIFDFIYSGRNIFGKDKVIRKVLKTHKITLNSAIYVGDETRDIEAAKKVPIPVIAVTWGFNSKEILATLQPDGMVDRPEELLKCLKGI